jgi:adenylyltransferase/sulfurtransferase
MPSATDVELPSLSAEEIKRYSRHLIMPEMGMDGQRALKSKSVL